MEGRKMEVCLIFAASLLVLAYGYPTTVPGSTEVCSKMTPGHGPAPQKSVAVYTVDVSKDAVQGGNNVVVTLSGNGNTFKGFYIQARDTSGNQVGTFSPDDEEKVKTHNCGGIKNNAAHHSSNNDKEQVRVNWKAPQNYVGTVTFVASFVQDFDNFWTFVKSKPVSVSISHLKFRPSLPIPGTGEEGKASKASEESRILTYNPYSPYSLLPQPEDRNNFPKFLASVNDTHSQNQENMTSESSVLIESSTAKTTQSNRRKKSSYHHLYIPRPIVSPPSQADETLILHHETDDDCDKTDFRPIHKQTSVNFIKTYTKLPRVTEPDYTVPSYYNPEAFKSRVKLPSTSSAFAGGFQKLDAFKPLPVSPPTPILPVRQKQFQSIASPPKSYLHGHPVTTEIRHTVSSSSLKDFNPGKSHPRIFFPHSNDYESPFYGNYNYNPTGSPVTHGVVRDDFDQDVIKTGIAIPKGMEHFELPRYGYLIFNPKRGPPFYLIPAPELDHLDGTAQHHDHFEGAISAQPVYSQKRISSLLG